MRIRGSNQHKTRWGLNEDTKTSIWVVAFFTLLLIHVLPDTTVKPCPDTGCENHFVKVVYAADERTELQKITDYIVYKFQPFGREVAVKALSCFISESGLRPDAYNWNTNNTADVGVAQINDVHKMTVEERKDWKKNIDKASEI
jgi:hypothetical protein